NKFLDVLAVSEHDATARGYLNQIEAALASAESAAPVSASTGDSDFMKHEIEAPAPPSFADDSGVGRGFTGDASGPGLEPAATSAEKAARPGARAGSACASSSRRRPFFSWRSPAARTGSCASGPPLAPRLRADLPRKGARRADACRPPRTRSR